MKHAKPIIHGRDHAIYGPDPVPGLLPAPPGGEDFADVILASNPDGLWKLNETSGTTAFDSSGNGRHLIVGSDSAPTWAQTAGPPGTVTAGFSTAAQRLHYSGYPILGADFTVVGYAYYTDSDPSDVYALMGQGTPAFLGGSGHDGWLLGIGGSSTGYVRKAVLFIGDGAGVPTAILSNNALTTATWYQIAFRRQSGLFTMFINGLTQAATTSDAMTSGSHDLIFGSTTGAGSSFHLDGRGSWWAVYSRALTSTELLDQYNSATAGDIDTTGRVLISDGAGGTSWGYVDTPNLTDEAITTAKIEPGTDGYVLTTAAGAVAWAPPTIRVNY